MDGRYTLMFGTGNMRMTLTSIRANTAVNVALLSCCLLSNLLAAASDAVPDVIVYNMNPLYPVQSDGYFKMVHSGLIVYGTDRPESTRQVLFSRSPDTGLGGELPVGAVVKEVEPFSSSEYRKVTLILPPADGRFTSTGAYTLALPAAPAHRPITALKLPNQAPLVPKQLSVRVNIEDSVVLQVHPDPHFFNFSSEITWRRNGEVLPFWRGGEQLIHSVSAEDGGVYEFYQGEADRARGRVGLLRVVVRRCGPLWFGPPSCDGHCPLCLNGGVCDDRSGQCICPPGFKGDHCQHACEESWFDQGCSSRCGNNNHLLARSCTGYQLCLQDPYGCSCAAGFRGIHCNDGCEPGSFGADCAQECRCRSGTACNPVTGECPDGCKPGFSGPSCQKVEAGGVSVAAFYNTRTNPGMPTDFVCALSMAHTPHSSDVEIQAPDGARTAASESVFQGSAYPYKWMFKLAHTRLGSYSCLFQGEKVASAELRVYELPQLRDALVVESYDKTFAVLRWTGWRRFYDSGDGPVTQYRVFRAKLPHDPEMIAEVRHGASQVYKYNATGLKPYTNYTFHIVTVRAGRNGAGQPSGSVHLRTKCDLMRFAPEDIDIMKLDSKEVMFKWKAAPCKESADLIKRYEWQFGLSEHFLPRYTRKGYEAGTVHLETGLSPYTAYFFRVRPMMMVGSREEPGQWSESNIFTSEDESSPPRQLRVVCSDTNWMRLAWRVPEFANGRISQYEIKYGKYPQPTDTRPPATPRDGFLYITQDVRLGTQTDYELKIDDLQPNATYTFRIRARNGYGPGLWSQEITGISEYLACPDRSAYMTAPPAVANLAVIAAIFVGVILTITIIIVAAVAYFGMNCGDDDSRMKAHDPRNMTLPVRKTSAFDAREYMETAYAPVTNCGPRLSNYHHETDSLLAENQIFANNGAGAALTMPTFGGGGGAHRAGGYSTLNRVDPHPSETLGRRNKPDGREQGSEEMFPEAKRNMDASPLRGILANNSSPHLNGYNRGDRLSDSTQHLESNNSSLRSERGGVVTSGSGDQLGLHLDQSFSPNHNARVTGGCVVYTPGANQTLRAHRQASLDSPPKQISFDINK